MNKLKEKPKYHWSTVLIAYVATGALMIFIFWGCSKLWPLNPLPPNKQLVEWNKAYNSLNYGRTIITPNGQFMVMEAWVDKGGQAWVRLYAGRAALMGKSGHDFLWKDANPNYPNFPKP